MNLDSFQNQNISQAGLGTISMRCIAAEPKQSFPFHEHDFCEFTYVSDDGATIGYPLGEIKVQHDTLLFYRPHERHGAWCNHRQSPRFWVVHFSIPTALLESFPALAEPNSRLRVWKLRAEQAESFKWFFLQLLNERTQDRAHRTRAETIWLELMLISVQRWTDRQSAKILTQSATNPDVIRLWHLVNTCVGEPGAFQKRISELPNYDSLRHGFKRAFGCSPRQMMLGLRLQHAKNLLLETSLSIKEISEQCGYIRQHEFSRAFRRQTGTAPSEWRTRPTVPFSTGAK